MKLGSFLLGGIVGAAAVVYLNSRSKAMLLSTFSGNRKGEQTNASTPQASSADFPNSNLKGSHSEKAEYGKIEEIINKEPQLRATVEQILTENAHKDILQQH